MKPERIRESGLMTNGEMWLQRLAAVVFAGCAAVVMISVSHGEIRFFLAAAGFAMTALACIAIGVAVHELGHLACAAIGSIPVYRVVIGDGPVLWRRRIRDIWFELRRWPLSGRVEPYAVMNYRWYRWALFLMGGVLGNLALVGVVAGLRAAGATGFVLDFALSAQVFLIAVSVIPLRGSGGNDAMLLLRLLRRPACDPAALRASYEAQVGGHCAEPRTLPMTAASLRLLHHIYRFWADGIPRAEVRDDLVHELERGDLSRAEQMWVLDALVTEGITSSDPAARPHLDAWSRQALALGPGPADAAGHPRRGAGRTRAS
jgi:Peptidase family M50